MTRFYKDEGRETLSCCNSNPYRVKPHFKSVSAAQNDNNKITIRWPPLRLKHRDLSMKQKGISCSFLGHYGSIIHKLKGLFSSYQRTSCTVCFERTIANKTNTVRCYFIGFAIKNVLTAHHNIWWSIHRKGIFLRKTYQMTPYFTALVPLNILQFRYNSNTIPLLAFISLRSLHVIGHHFLIEVSQK